MTKRHLADWLHYIHQHAPGPLNHRFEWFDELFNRLGYSKPAPYVVSVTGTNGKGSVVLGLSHLLSKAGLQVGTLTSPHLVHYNERIQISENIPSDAQLESAFLRVDRKVSDANEPMKYWEWTFLVAMEVFSQADLDVVILEAGIGGTYDCINVIDADLSVITSVGLDHQEILGDSLAKIASQKMGLFRPGQTAIIGSMPDLNWVKQSKFAEDMQFKCLGEDYNVELTDEGDYYVCDHQKIRLLNKSVLPVNQSIIVAAFEVMVRSGTLKSKLNSILELSYLTFIETSLQEISCPGRLDYRASTRVLFDVAHNIDSAKMLANYVQHHWVDGRVLGVFAAAGHKDIKGMLEAMRGEIEVLFIAPLPGAAESDFRDIQLTAKSLGYCVEACKDPIGAYKMALSYQRPGDYIVVFGSFLTVGQVMQSHEGTME